MESALQVSFYLIEGGFIEEYHRSLSIAFHQLALEKMIPRVFFYISHSLRKSLGKLLFSPVLYNAISRLNIQQLHANCEAAIDFLCCIKMSKMVMQRSGSEKLGTLLLKRTSYCSVYIRKGHNSLHRDESTARAWEHIYKCYRWQGGATWGHVKKYCDYLSC